MLEAEDKVLRQHVGHVLRHIWDPIGLSTEGPTDEYDSYVSGAVALVRDTRVSEAQIFAHLVQIEHETMGLPAVPERDTRAARALLGLRQACSRGTELLITQMVNQDGLGCLWVFRRPDGLFHYEHAALRCNTDENGAWIWWAFAGEGRSGLFATAEVATQDAHAAVDWLR